MFVHTIYTLICAYALLLYEFQCVFPNQLVSGYWTMTIGENSCKAGAAPMIVLITSRLLLSTVASMEKVDLSEKTHHPLSEL